MLYFKKSFHVWSLLVCLGTGLADAQSIRIIDCQGNTKALRQLDAVTKSSMQITVTDVTGVAANSGEVRLQNGVGQELIAKVEDGVAIFPEVAEGVWQMSSSQSGIYFSKIVLDDALVPTFWTSLGDTALTVAKIVGVAAVAVGSVAIIHHATNGSGNHDSSDSGSGGSDQPGGTCPACDPNQGAPSIPVFN